MRFKTQYMGCSDNVLKPIHAVGFSACYLNYHRVMHAAGKLDEERKAGKGGREGASASI